MKRLLSLGLVAALLAGCSAAASPSASSTGAPAVAAGLQAIKDRGVLYQGFANESPWSYINAEGTFVGLDTEILQECAKRLSLPDVLGVQNAFDGLIPGLQAKRYDAVGAGLSWRNKRVEVADATDGIYYINTSPMVQKGNPKNIQSAADIVNGDAKVGAIQGSTEYLLAQDKVGERAQGYADQSQLMADLIAGRIDVALNPEAILIDYKAKNPDAAVEILPIPWINGFGVWYLNQDADDLREALNGCLKEMKADGSMGKIFEKYGFPATNVIPDATEPFEPEPAF